MTGPVSLASTLIVTAVFPGVTAVSLFAIAGSRKTVTVTVAGAETAPSPSPMVYVNVSVPKKFTAGV